MTSDDCGWRLRRLQLGQIATAMTTPCTGCADETACNYRRRLGDVTMAHACTSTSAAICGGTGADADMDGICDCDGNVDDCVCAYDECGVCNGSEVDADMDGMPVMMWTIVSGLWMHAAFATALVLYTNAAVKTSPTALATATATSLTSVAFAMVHRRGCRYGWHLR